MDTVSTTNPDAVQAEINARNWRAAIAALMSSYSKNKSPELLVKLRDLRMEIGEELVGLKTDGEITPCPPLAADPFPDTNNNIPEIEAADLNSETLAGAIRHHGAVIVRGMADRKFCEEQRYNIDQSIAGAKEFYSVKARDRHKMVRDVSQKDIWFSLFPQVKNHATSGEIHMMFATGAVWTFLSPKVADRLTRFFDDANLRPLLQQYFEDDPCLSLNKSVLRRITPLANPADWHQDGAFMSTDIKSLNLWVALSECGAGTNAPGMDLIPKRLSKVVETGTNGAAFDWSVSHKSVGEWFKESPPVRPYFAEGDAIFFDHLNLHATSYDAEFTKPRYAIETWFFAQNHNADNQTPAYW